VRAGTHALSLLSVPLNVHVLTALADGPKPLIDLRHAAGSPPQTTTRSHLCNLVNIGILERRRHKDFPLAVDYELTTAGRELLGIATVLQVWLASSPKGELTLGALGAKSTIRALAEGWSSTLIRALAARPLSLTQLSRLIPSLNYPALERRLSEMRLAGLIEACPGEARATPYMVADWLRRAVAPLGAAALWERRHDATRALPVGRVDIEAVFLLVVPLLGLPSGTSGSCRFAVEVRNADGRQDLVGVLVEIEEGRVVSCVTRLQGTADAWVSGSTAAWLSAMIEDETRRFEIGGDCALAAMLTDGLHEALFATAPRS
jgi:DNA-binding HxlR family transcriptional regulator